MEKLTLKKEALAPLLVKLGQANKKVWAPRKTASQVNFEPVTSATDLADDYLQTQQSAKFALLPRVEELFRFQTNDRGLEIIDRDLAAIEEVVLFGIRPCDAAAFAVLDTLFSQDYPDILFKTRLQKLSVIGLSCSQADEYCFCTSLAGDPGATRGSDILLTKLTNGDYLAEIVTEKGQAIRALADDLFTPEPMEAKEKNLARVAKRFDLDRVQQNLPRLFDSDLWIKDSLRCLGCGACAFLCPTCACFDIQDEGDASHGRRLRCWDSCGFSLFTLHASGHNPRTYQSQRWRQRMMHKFSYMSERLGVLGCVGCGRCQRACPADMSLVEQLQAIEEA